MFKSIIFYFFVRESKTNINTVVYRSVQNPLISNPGNAISNRYIIPIFSANPKIPNVMMFKGKEITFNIGLIM